MSKQKRYWLFTLIGTLAVSAYPLYMAVKVLYAMMTIGAVPKEAFPKYIIPYTPIAVALIVTVALMPLFFRFLKRYITAASLVSVGIFFAAEWFFERQIIVEQRPLESWQMLMCYVPPDFFETRTWTAVDVLMGEYSPVFKIHFYLIAIVLILAILNVIYGFADMLHNGRYERRKALTVQSVCAGTFLGLCLLACFTAFFRDGELTVSPLSACLMCAFFVLLGVTVGVYAASFLLDKRKAVSVVLPSAIAATVTLAMYIGEMCLLSGHLYILGSGWFFEPLPFIVLSFMDMVVIFLAGGVTALIARLLNNKQVAFS